MSESKRKRRNKWGVHDSTVTVRVPQSIVEDVQIFVADLMAAKSKLGNGEG